MGFYSLLDQNQQVLEFPMKLNLRKMSRSSAASLLSFQQLTGLFFFFYIKLISEQHVASQKNKPSISQWKGWSKVILLL